MSPLHVLLIATVAWVALPVAAAFEKAASGNPGGVSLAPALPVFPLLAWGLAGLLDWLAMPVGVNIVGGLHGVLLVLALVSVLVSRLKLRRRNRP